MGTPPPRPVATAAAGAGATTAGGSADEAQAGGSEEDWDEEDEDEDEEWSSDDEGLASALEWADLREGAAVPLLCAHTDAARGTPARQPCHYIQWQILVINRTVQL